MTTTTPTYSIDATTGWRIPSSGDWEIDTVMHAALAGRISALIDANRRWLVPLKKLNPRIHAQEVARLAAEAEDKRVAAVERSQPWGEDDA